MQCGQKLTRVALRDSRGMCRFTRRTRTACRILALIGCMLCYFTVIGLYMPKTPKDDWPLHIWEHRFFATQKSRAFFISQVQDLASQLITKCATQEQSDTELSSWCGAVHGGPPTAHQQVLRRDWLPLQKGFQHRGALGTGRCTKILSSLYLLLLALCFVVVVFASFVHFSGGFCRFRFK